MSVRLRGSVGWAAMVWLARLRFARLLAEGSPQRRDRVFLRPCLGDPSSPARLTHSSCSDQGFGWWSSWPRIVGGKAWVDRHHGPIDPFIEIGRDHVEL